MQVYAFGLGLRQCTARWTADLGLQHNRCNIFPLSLSHTLPFYILLLKRATKQLDFNLDARVGLRRRYKEKYWENKKKKEKRRKRRLGFTHMCVCGLCWPLLFISRALFVGRVVILKETQREGERYFWANPQCFVLWCGVAFACVFFCRVLSRRETLFLLVCWFEMRMRNRFSRIKKWEIFKLE